MVVQLIGGTVALTNACNDLFIGDIFNSTSYNFAWLCVHYCLAVGLQHSDDLFWCAGRSMLT